MQETDQIDLRRVGSRRLVQGNDPLGPGCVARIHLVQVHSTKKRSTESLAHQTRITDELKDRSRRSCA
jgi:hypothetical protein